jgi:hypothetical protein
MGAKRISASEDLRAPRVTVSLLPADHVQLQRIADEHDRSVSWVVRKAVRLLLQEQGSPPPSPDAGRAA